MRLIKQALAAAVIGLMTALPAHASVIDLGLADDYSLLATGSPYGASMVLGSAVDIGGNIGARDSVGIGTGSVIHGNVHGGSITYDSSSRIHGTAETRTNGYWDQVHADLRAASAQAAGLTGSARGAVTTTTTLRGSGLSVFNLDSLNLQGGETLFLDGDAGTEFILNVSGNFLMNAGASIVALNGLDPLSITFNIINGGMIQMNNATAIGTFLAAEGFIQLGDGNILEATRFLGGTLQGNLQTLRPPVPTDVALPGLAGLFLIGFAAIGLQRRHRTV